MMAFNNCVPDVWVSGIKTDLWIEFKYLKKVPKRNTTIIQHDLSELQARWLLNRHHEGRNVCVIIGSSSGAYIYEDLTWSNANTTNIHLTLTQKQVAEWIISRVNK